MLVLGNFVETLYYFHKSCDKLHCGVISPKIILGMKIVYHNRLSIIDHCRHHLGVYEINISEFIDLQLVLTNVLITNAVTELVAINIDMHSYVCF